MSDIESQTKTIKTIFQHFFEVPKYQRDYVWDEELAINLLSNLEDAMNQGRNQYFIGAIVLQTKDENTYFIVDGQQRLSTLFLILLALDNKAKKLQSGGINIVRNNIFTETTTPTGIIKKDFRILYNFSQTNDLVKNIFENDDDILLPTDNKRTEKFVEAYKQLADEIDRKFTDIPRIIKFLDFLTYNVVCLPFISKNQQEAIEIFDILNSKGIDLSTIDLLKNKLFTILGDDSWDDFSDRWDKLLDKLESTKLDKTKFLRYYTIFKNKEVIAEKNLYTEISSNENKYGLNSPEIYLENITKAVDYLIQIKNNQNPLVRGEKIPVLDYINKISSQSKQQIPLTMKLWEVSTNLSDQNILINGLKLIESFIFLNKILKEYTGEIETRFNSWCINLPERDVNAANEYLKSERNSLISSRTTEIELELHNADLRSQSKNFIKWCLVRMENYLQDITDPNSTYSYMDSFKSFQIEHIIPYNFYRNLPEDEQESYKDKINNIGNLTLLEKSLNARLQDEDYTQKREIYAESKSFLTKSMHSHINDGNSLYVTMYSNLNIYEEFDDVQIKNRNRLLTSILLKAVFS
jgi:uncharacterized protein with ParB-like and HNH nuclease domain